jgi:hypothetical protein
MARQLRKSGFFAVASTQEVGGAAKSDAPAAFLN